MARAQRSSLTHSFCQEFSHADRDISDKKTVLKAPQGVYWKIYHPGLVVLLIEILNCFS
jgi:hypothetical protein